MEGNCIQDIYINSESQRTLRALASFSQILKIIKYKVTVLNNLGNRNKWFCTEFKVTLTLMTKKPEPGKFSWVPNPSLRFHTA